MMMHIHRPLRRLGQSFIWLLVVGICLSTAAVGRAQSKDAKNILRTSSGVLAAFHDVVARPSQSTVRVKCDGKDVALGTVVAADGWILTKFSELKGLAICRLKDGREFEAQLVGVHDKCDLAMLKIEVSDLMPVAWAESKVAPVGNWVASPGLDKNPVAIGVVSVASRNVSDRNTAPTPSPTSGFLGVGLDLDFEGVKIKEIIAGSGAEKAGLRVNDRILTVNGDKVATSDEFINMLQRRKIGEAVTLKIVRGDKEMDVEAKLGRRPNSSRGDFQNSLGSELSERRTGFPTILQHDSVIEPKCCGGPLVDLDGHVIGINIARAGRTESYAVPTELVLTLLADLKSGKLPPPLARSTKLSDDDVKKLTDAKSALQKAEAERAEAERKVAEARAALERLQSQKGKDVR